MLPWLNIPLLRYWYRHMQSEPTARCTLARAAGVVPHGAVGGKPGAGRPSIGRRFIPRSGPRERSSLVRGLDRLRHRERRLRTEPSSHLAHHARNGSRRHGRAVEIALDLLAASADQDVELLARLHPFG